MARLRSARTCMRCSSGSLPDHDFALACVTSAWTAARGVTPRGFVSLGSVTPASINYVTKYLVQDDPFAGCNFVPDDLYRKYLDQRRPVFANISKGIGKGYLTERADWHDHNLERFFAVLQGGTRVRLPRYYRDKLYTEEERLFHNEEVMFSKYMDLIENCNLSPSERHEAERVEESRRIMLERKATYRIKQNAKI